MNENIFWNFIKESLEESNNDQDLQHEILTSKLTRLSEEQILEFDKIFNKFYMQSYTSDLWAAAYIINEGCSDDGFDYFRGWLISKGKEVFENALNDPSSIADAIDIDEFEEAEFEDMLYVAYDAYRIKTNKEDFYNKVERVRYPEIELTWNEDERDLEEMFPRLTRLFWEK